MNSMNSMNLDCHMKPRATELPRMIIRSSLLEIAAEISMQLCISNDDLESDSLPRSKFASTTKQRRS